MNRLFKIFKHNLADTFAVIYTALTVALCIFTVIIWVQNNYNFSKSSPCILGDFIQGLGCFPNTVRLAVNINAPGMFIGELVLRFLNLISTPSMQVGYFFRNLMDSWVALIFLFVIDLFFYRLLGKLLDVIGSRLFRGRRGF